MKKYRIALIVAICVFVFLFASRLYEGNTYLAAFIDAGESGALWFLLIFGVQKITRRWRNR